MWEWRHMSRNLTHPVNVSGFSEILNTSSRAARSVVHPRRRLDWGSKSLMVTSSRSGATSNSSAASASAIRFSSQARSWSRRQRAGWVMTGGHERPGDVRAEWKVVQSTVCGDRSRPLAARRMARRRGSDRRSTSASTTWPSRPPSSGVSDWGEGRSCWFADLGASADFGDQRQELGPGRTIRSHREDGVAVVRNGVFDGGEAGE